MTHSCLSGSATDRAGAIAQRCGGGRKSKQGWMACCPAHEDHHPSLHITAADDRVLMHCYAGCDIRAIVEALALTMNDLFDSDIPITQLRRKPRPNHQPARPAPPEGPADPFILAWAIDLVIDDPAMLTVDGLTAVLKHAATCPLQWLWVERACALAGLTSTVLWQAICPQTDYPSLPPIPQSSTLTYEQRLAARLRKATNGR